MGSRGDHLWEISMSFKDSHIVILNLNCFISFSRPPWLNFICNLMLEENFIFIHLYLLKAVSRLSFSHFVNNANNERTKSQLRVKRIFLPRNNIKYFKQQKRTLKNYWAKNFQNHSCNPIQSVLWGCPTLSTVIFAVLFITSFNVLSAVIFMFHSIWWQFPLFELW